MLQPYQAERAEAVKGSLKSLLQKIGSAHLAVSVNNLQEAYVELKVKGVEFVSGFDEKFFFCQDPDGFLIEVRQK